MNISEMQSQLKDELGLLTEAQSKLDEAMETIAPLQQQVNASRGKLKALSVAILKELNVIVRRGRGWVLDSAELPSTAAAATESGSNGNVPEWGEPKAKKATKGTGKQKRKFSPETKIAAARRMAEMHARRAGKSKAMIAKIGREMEAKKRAELGL